MVGKPVFSVDQIITELTTNLGSWSPRRSDGAVLDYSICRA